MATRLKKGFTLIELMIVVAIIGILAAIAVPNFIKFQARSKQSEVRANLKALWTAEKAYFQEKDTYSNLINAIGFEPERGNRYSYSLTGTTAAHAQGRGISIITYPPYDDGIQADTWKYGSSAGISPTMPGAFPAVVNTGNTGDFSVTAASNIDTDATFDQWSISSISRASGAPSDASTSCAAGNNPAGEPCVDLNDI